MEVICSSWIMFCDMESGVKGSRPASGDVNVKTDKVLVFVFTVI